jgi:hypothetical protein
MVIGAVQPMAASASTIPITRPANPIIIGCPSQTLAQRVNANLGRERLLRNAR